MRESGKDTKIATLKECLPLIKKWTDSHIQYGGLEEMRPSKLLIKSLIETSTNPNNTVSSNLPAIYYYFYQVEKTDCQGTGDVGVTGGPGSCWVK